MKLTERFGRTGKFRPRLLRDAPLLDAMMRAKCERVSKGNRTRTAQYRALVMDGMRQLQAEIASRAHV